MRIWCTPNYHPTGRRTDTARHPLLNGGERGTRALSARSKADVVGVNEVTAESYVLSENDSSTEAWDHCALWAFASPSAWGYSGTNIRPCGAFMPTYIGFMTPVVVLTDNTVPWPAA